MPEIPGYYGTIYKPDTDNTAPYTCSVCGGEEFDSLEDFAAHWRETTTPRHW